MLDFYYNVIDKYIEHSDFDLTEMDIDSNYFALSEDSIDKLIKPCVCVCVWGGGCITKRESKVTSKI